MLGFPGRSHGKESACSAGDLGSIPGSERSPQEGHGNPLQCSFLESSIDRGAWRATVHGVTKSQHDWVTNTHSHTHTHTHTHAHAHTEVNVGCCTILFSTTVSAIKIFSYCIFCFNYKIKQCVSSPWQKNITAMAAACSLVPGFYAQVCC